MSLDQNWRFGGRITAAAVQPGFEDSGFAIITLPHTVTPLSWKDWQPDSWQDVWIYRRHFETPGASRGQRTFLHFERVMAAANVTVNGHELPAHQGGFLPFTYEITGLLQDSGNVLAVAVDGRWLNVPPAGSPRGPRSVDYLLPAGITGSVSLRVVPPAYISDVFARAVNVLESSRHLLVTAHIDRNTALPADCRITAILRDGDRTIARTSRRIDSANALQSVELTLDTLHGIALWDVERPQLYHLEVTLLNGHSPLHTYRTRIGFRDARFEVDGFFLNGKRLQIFGLNRQELYPYVGFAAPPRLLRQDAEILRHRFHCNMVRCSHYPQSPAFLDACDELGLMVWEEIPGWQYLGDAAWKECAVRDVEAMILRDRNRPSVIIWGTRVNESANDPDLYRRTRELARSLDPTRPSSGTMTPDSMKTWRTEWHEDVLAYDDYHAEPDGSVGILPPPPGVPYMLAETVGQFSYSARRGFNAKYRRAADPSLQAQQAVRHAQAHSRAAEYPHCAGTIAWCAFDYASLVNADAAIKCPGVADVFRIPKLGAAFYLAQVDPTLEPVIEPSFYWDFGPATPNGPGDRAAIFSNCERLDLFIDGKPHATLVPDYAGFPHLKHPPCFANLMLETAHMPELRIDGYLGERRVLSRTFSSNRAADTLTLRADDAKLIPDGADATWLVFGVADSFGAPHMFGTGAVTLTLDGPATIVGDNPFELAENGGWGAVLLRTIAGRAGLVRITAAHPTLGRATVSVEVSPSV